LFARFRYITEILYSWFDINGKYYLKRITYLELQSCVKCAKCVPKIKTCDNNLASTMFEEKTEQCLQN